MSDSKSKKAAEASEVVVDETANMPKVLIKAGANVKSTMPSSLGNVPQAQIPVEKDTEIAYSCIVPTQPAGYIGFVTAGESLEGVESGSTIWVFAHESEQKFELL